MESVSFLDTKHFDTKPQIDVMLETPLSKEIRICMDVGNIMREHTAPAAIIIMVIEGEVSIASKDQNMVLKAGEIIFFEAKVPHSLEAIERSVIRLSLSKNDTVKRIIGVI